MNLTVVTHTNPTWNRDISRCLQSVKDALPEGCKHEVIELFEPNTLSHARYNAKFIDDIIVFVDDDDYIPIDSLYRVLDAMRKTYVGVVYTRETKVARNGVMELNTPTTNYSQLITHPQSVHHMTAFRTKYITPRCLELVQTLKMNGAMEWSMRNDAAYNGGALYVPINGYYWVQHKDQYHLNHITHRSVVDGMRSATKLMQDWADTSIYKGNIPVEIAV